MHLIRLHRRTASFRGGFTLVELLVVIGIIAILAGVALGPITNGLKKAKQSSGVQTSHAIGVAMFSYANDNSQIYPDGSGADASTVAKALLNGSYITDPNIFYLAGGTASKYAGSAASAATSITASNVSWDFAGNGGSGLNTTVAQYLPLVWSSVVGGTEPQLSGSSAITATPSASNPFGQQGIAIFYCNESASFQNANISNFQVTMVPAANNGATAPATVAPLLGGG
jgi:prepilin-type N-terminal cleavage/methylation domain-containing protein